MSFFLCFALTGCNESELKSLNDENLKLKKEIATLEIEIKKLHETAEYHFRLGQDYLSSDNWDSAIESFNTVIKKYPNDSLVTPARKSLIEAEGKRQAYQEKAAEEERVQNEEREKEIAKSGEEIYYGDFYAKSRTGLTIGKRFKFSACMNQTPCLRNPDALVDQTICSIEPQFDDQAEYEHWLGTGEKYCGNIVASMLWGGTIAVHRLH